MNYRHFLLHSLQFELERLGSKSVNQISSLVQIHQEIINEDKFLSKYSQNIRIDSSIHFNA